MDVVRSEVEEKIRKSSRKLKDPSFEPKKNKEKEEEYWEKVKELEKQNLLMLKMIRKEEEDHEKEKEKWTLQVKELKDDLKRVVRNQDEIFFSDQNENNPPVFKHKNNHFRCENCRENQEDFRKIREKYEKLKENKKKLSSDVMCLTRENRRLKNCLDDTSEIEKRLASKNAMLEEDNKIIVKEYTALKERFSRYQADQDSKITTLEQEMDHLSSTLSKFLSFLSLSPE
jgi:hypothetical protein